MSNLKSLLLECEYFPCIDWYKHFVSQHMIILESFEHFERATLRNRCYISGPNGKLALSVPLHGGRNQRMPMNKIKVSYQDRWQTQHWRTLKTCYNRSPYFEFFEMDFERFFSTNFDSLFELNLASIQLLNRLLGIKKSFEITSAYEKQVTDDTIDMRQVWTVQSTNQGNVLRYLQPFEDKIGFVANLSMLDLLFCCGKQATELLLKP